MGNVKRYLFENRNFDPDYDPDADHRYQYEDDEEEEEYGVAETEIEDIAQEAAPPPTFSEEEVLSAQQTAFDEGKAAGFEEANAQFERLIATALTQISGSIPQAFQQYNKAQEEREAHALSVAGAVVKKIIPAYTEKHGLGEIIDVVSQCLEPLRSEPRIIVKVHESLRETVHEKLTHIGEQIGFDGRIVTMGHDDIVPGDCRVEWSEGGAERSSKAMWQLIDEILERNLTQGTNQGETQSAIKDEAETDNANPL